MSVKTLIYGSVNTAQISSYLCEILITNFLFKFISELSLPIFFELFLRSMILLNLLAVAVERRVDL